MSSVAKETAEERKQRKKLEFEQDQRYIAEKARSRNLHCLDKDQLGPTIEQWFKLNQWPNSIVSEWSNYSRVEGASPGAMGEVLMGARLPQKKFLIVMGIFNYDVEHQNFGYITDDPIDKKAMRIRNLLLSGKSLKKA